MNNTRRNFVQLTAQAFALPATLELFAAACLRGDEAVHSHSAAAGTSAAPPDPQLLRDYSPRFFDKQDFPALEAFTEILIPTDETPGAREARCAHYIDFLLSSANDVPALQQEWRHAFDRLRTLGFQSADAATRAALVEKLSHPADDAHAVFRLIKRANTFAFYTSRVGLIDNLDYRGSSYNETFPPCTHPEHQRVG